MLKAESYGGRPNVKAKGGWAMLASREYYFKAGSDQQQLANMQVTAGTCEVLLTAYLLDREWRSRNGLGPDDEFNHWNQAGRRLRLLALRPTADSAILALEAVHLIHDRAADRILAIEFPRVTGSVDLRTFVAMLRIPGAPECDPLRGAV